MISYPAKKAGLTLYISVLIFCMYSCIFAFRKPFTVATFGEKEMLGISYQTLLIISQVIGYMLSKFAGIRFISSLKRTGRWKSTVMIMSGAWLSLLLFAILPDWAGVLCFMANGFLLGFMWGIVFSYAEGRNATDFIGSVLAVSFIFAGGFTRSVGKWLMTDYGVSQDWMPFMTGLIFAVPLVLLIYLMERVPAPDAKDIENRVERKSMNADDRRKIIREFSAGIIVLCIVYTFLTIIRDLRDNFMANIWNELGYANDYTVFARSETRISFFLLLMMGSLVLIRKNIIAFRVIHLLIISGFLLAGISSALFYSGNMQGAWWMQAVGLGLYMAYIPFNAIFFDRMIATFRISGNVGFLIYITDAFGYLGSVSIMLAKESLRFQIPWADFYSGGVIIFAAIGAIGTAYSMFYFNRKHSQQKKTAENTGMNSLQA
jgi:MFS family permease